MKKKYFLKTIINMPELYRKVLYYFYNENKQKDDQNYQYYTRFNEYSADQMKEIFLKVIHNNNWDLYDCIIAQSIDFKYPTFTFMNGNVIDNCYDNSEYEDIFMSDD